VTLANLLRFILAVSGSPLGTYSARVVSPGDLMLL
jgi:hypothetical protein